MQQDDLSNRKSNSNSPTSILFFMALIVCILLLVGKVVFNIRSNYSLPSSEKKNSTYESKNHSSNRNNINSTDYNTITGKLENSWNSIKNYVSSAINEEQSRDPIHDIVSRLTPSNYPYSIILHDTKVDDEKYFLQFQIIEMPYVHHELSYNDFTITEFVEHTTVGFQRATEEYERNKSASPNVAGPSQIGNNYNLKTNALLQEVIKIELQNKNNSASERRNRRNNNPKYEEWISVTLEKYNYFSTLKGKTIVTVIPSSQYTRSSHTLIANVNNPPGFEYVGNVHYGVWFTDIITGTTRWYWFTPFRFWSKDFGLPEIITKEEFDTIIEQEQEILAGENPNNLYFYKIVGAENVPGNYREHQEPIIYKIVEKKEIDENPQAEKRSPNGSVSRIEEIGSGLPSISPNSISVEEDSDDISIFNKVANSWSVLTYSISNWIYEYQLANPIHTVVTSLKSNESTYSLILHDTKILNKRFYLQFEIIEIPLVHENLPYEDYLIAEYFDHTTNGRKRAAAENGGKDATANPNSMYISNFSALIKYGQKEMFLAEKIKSFDIDYFKLNQSGPIPDKTVTGWLPVKKKQYTYFVSLKGKTVAKIKQYNEKEKTNKVVIANINTAPGYEHVGDTFLGVWLENPKTKVTKWYWFNPVRLAYGNYILPEISKEEFEEILEKEKQILEGDNSNDLYFFHTTNSSKSLGNYRNIPGPSFYRRAAY